MTFTKQVGRSSQPGFVKGFLKGMAAMAAMLTRGHNEAWNHWLFLCLHGYEIHIAGPGVPVETKELERWAPLLDDISTLEFRPCVVEAKETGHLDVSCVPSQPVNNMNNIVGKLGPILASDQFLSISEAGHYIHDPHGLHKKVFVAEKIIKDFDVTETLFRKGVMLEPRNADLLGDFALFMQDVRGDHDLAEELYRRALSVDPHHGKNLGNFANFLYDVRRDYDEAEMFYRSALDLEPDLASHMGNYALFLYEARGKVDLAEEYYRRAWRVDPNDAVILANFALFLHDTRSNDDLADKLYRHAMEIKGDDANCLGNYALFMKNVRHDYDMAETLFRRAVQVDPNHAVHLGNFALFMKNIRRNRVEAEALYRQAIKANPDDPNNLGDLDWFIKNLIYNKNVIEEHALLSLDVDIGQANRFGGFVQMLLSQGRVKEGLPLLDKAIAMNVSNPALSLEFWFYVLVYDVNRFDHALARIKGFIQAGVRVKAEVHRGRFGGHPESELVQTLAKVISGVGEVESLDGFGGWVEAVAEF